MDQMGIDNRCRWNEDTIARKKNNTHNNKQRKREEKKQ
jgi:hypothetical protein